VIPDNVDPRRMPRWTEKNEAVQRLLVNTNALITAWNTYTRWVDEHRGPTGKENGTGRFGGIDRGQFINAAQTARALARQAPQIAPLDELLDAMRSASRRSFQLRPRRAAIISGRTT
jgi:hypothetical protein